MDDLKPYDFIALVNVEAVSPPDTTDQFKGMRLSGTFKMEVMTLFKGEAVDEITDPLVRTDCAMGFIKGQQWLVFGYLQDGKIITSICSYSILYRDASGRREWGSFNGIRQLAVLRDLFHQPGERPLPRMFYPDGNIELEQHFKNGKITGRRCIYYPDGRLYIAERLKRVKELAIARFFLQAASYCRWKFTRANISVVNFIQ